MTAIVRVFKAIIINTLPLSPFREYISYFNAWPYIGWLNWFLPVRGYLVVWGVWLGSVGSFYLYQVVLRWMKAIQ